ncbi:ABC transporter ATP-binding protein [Desulfitobacterium hafniense]|uniref:ABC transporter ATP-binding protein n=1 Tax=Desulfitobacterium hafniense TaxID=49338 RepID=UPI0003A809D8|nr:ABC transporter ATP-binding protein [Desulfitobacterium hafniense]
MNNSNYLTIESLNVVYSQNGQLTPALKDVSLNLPQGQIGAIIGPSGCGKSTLLNVVAGLNKTYQGKVLLKGAPPQANNEVALILQEYGLLPWKTVWDNVRLGLQIKGIAGAQAAQRTEEILEQLGLLHLRKRFPIQLSGGQRQRVAIARSLVLHPELLLMDEPFSSLDALTREEMQDLVLKVWQETGLTILIITHNIEEAVFLGQKIFVMSPCPGIITQEIHNPLAGDYEARGKMEFLEVCNALRLSLRGRCEACL